VIRICLKVENTGDQRHPAAAGMLRFHVHGLTCRVEGSEPVALASRTCEGQVVAVPTGAPVIESDRMPVGRLTAIDAAAILVRPPGRRGVYVPFEFVADVTNDSMVLTIPAEQIDAMHWRNWCIF
jgi:hypothetical protein